MDARIKARRDALGYAFFCLHIAILAFIVLGWTIAMRGVLIFYLAFLPATVLHWKLNQDACILSNLENWLRHRRWRAPEKNPEEGAWLRTLIRSMTGITLSKSRANLFIYIAMGLFWALAWFLLRHFRGP